MRCAVKPLQGGPRGERSIRDRERVREAVERPPRASPTSSARCGTAIAAIAATVTRPSASTFIDTRATVPRSSHKPIGAETDGPVSGVIPRIAVAIREAWLSRHAVRARH